MTKKPHSTDREEENSPAKFSRRTTLASLLGLSGFSVSNSQTVQGTNSNSRPWKQDVNAQGHKLSNLGSLSTANNSDEITDFAGENLSISGSGVLNATATNGGMWESGEKIHLASINGEERFNVIAAGGNYRTTTRANRAISTNQLSFSNVTKTYLSLSGWTYGSENDIISLRLYDRTTDTPIPNSEVEIETEGLEDSSPIQIPFYGPKAEYESTEPHIIHAQYKTTAPTPPDGFASVKGIVIHVWGEV